MIREPLQRPEQRYTFAFTGTHCCQHECGHGAGRQAWSHHSECRMTPRTACSVNTVLHFVAPRRPPGTVGCRAGRARRPLRGRSRGRVSVRHRGPGAAGGSCRGAAAAALDIPFGQLHRVGGLGSFLWSTASALGRISPPGGICV